MRRRALARALAAIVLPLLLAAQATGCSGDEETATSAAPTKPELTVPGERPRSPERARDRKRDTSSPSEPSPAPTSTTAGPSTSTAPAQPTTQPPDSASNDTPPPAGSAADRFEKACRENPEACR